MVIMAIMQITMKPVESSTEVNATMGQLVGMSTSVLTVLSLAMVCWFVGNIRVIAKAQTERNLILNRSLQHSKLEMLISKITF